MKELPKAYQPENYEDKIYRFWEESGFFKPGKKGKPFSIVLPPPNVTGKLHIGHAAMLSYQDIMTRYHRMRGDKTLWLPGMDHAAIATQNVVEKELNKQGKTRYDLGREKFLAKVNQFAEQSKVVIRNQLKKMGSSLDWSREKFTLEQSSSLAVKTAFKKMSDDGLIYRGERVINWCPRCQTTLADDEVVYQEAAGQLYYISYGPITVATTRPETKLGDTGVAVNPKDERYKKYLGKVLEVDLAPHLNEVNAAGLASHKIKVKVFADRTVDPTFGTGAIGVTPAHSQQDYQWAEKYHLPIIKVIDEQGKMTAAAGSYQGLSVLECREKLVANLKQAGKLSKVEEIINNLSVCYRCGSPIEPLPSKQWFIAVNKKIPGRGKTLKQLATEAVKNGSIKIIPDRFNKTYFQWMVNLRDWCISRQIWYGHRIPVWYKQPGQIMGFYEKVIPQLYQGKTKTYRLRDHQFKIGDEVAFENSQTGEIFGQGRIINVVKTTVGQINLKDKAHGATYDNVEELIKAFKKHHPDKEVTVKTPVIIYEYKFSQNSKNNSNIYVGTEPPQGENWIQDEDTLDTWFSSSLWTFTVLGWPALTRRGRPVKTKDLKVFHPTSVLETGYDILFFWVARMILMSTYLVKQVPFKTVYLHGLIRDKEGRKMSKSLGNGIDPLEMIGKFGADALRISMVIGVVPGGDVRLYEEKIAGYRNFVNKLWNISRYILTKVQDTNNKKQKKSKLQTSISKTLADNWILEELENIIASTTKNIEEFKFSTAGEELYEFTWNKLADWYLEIAKIEGHKDQILLAILEKLLILWHPFCPFVTEALWREMGHKNLLMVEKWPTVKAQSLKLKAQEFSLIQQAVTAIRNTRSERKVNSKDILDCSITTSSAAVRANLHLIEGLAKVKVQPKVSGIKIHLPKIDLIIVLPIDQNFQANNVQEIANLEKYIKLQEQKLTNRQFIAKAPEAVVKSEREKLQQAKERLMKLK